MQALASNAVVAEVAEDVGEVCQAVVFSTEAQVALIIEPRRHGTAAGHKHPLPNVKLPVNTHTYTDNHSVMSPAPHALYRRPLETWTMHQHRCVTLVCCLTTAMYRHVD